MKRPAVHILVCSSFRSTGETQGVCKRKGAASLLGILEEAVADRGLDAAISTTSCLKACNKGPAMVIHPHNWWYGEVTEDRLDEILDALEQGRAVGKYLL